MIFRSYFYFQVVVLRASASEREDEKNKNNVIKTTKTDAIGQKVQKERTT